jgi:hypothetical protein
MSGVLKSDYQFSELLFFAISSHVPIVTAQHEVAISTRWAPLLRVVGGLDVSWHPLAAISPTKAGIPGARVVSESTTRESAILVDTTT